MGIPGLQTYMENADKSPICRLVDISVLAKKTKRSPTIIVDLDSWLVPMTSPHFMWGGGELKVYFEKVEKFVRKFKARLPDGDSQILRLYVFGPSGLKDYGSATLRCKI